ncbi:MAG: hypothetical protein JSW26_26905 [Desulfobacterales bacterium]|nr:MAG: hypothetical protein JSW26_26905 [Desulfobacterales bacterium]
MKSGNKLMALVSVVIVAFILQVVLIIADHRDSPGEAAVEFSRAYFKLKPSMADRLCSEITAEEDGSVVGDYLNRVADEARANGFEPGWMKMALSHIELKTEMIDENTAEVHISCTRRRSMNPLFGIVAKIFFLGETHKVDETLTVVKEDDGWKVCGQPYSLLEG